MSRLDDLPPDQRAALSLLLGQGKDYAQVAALLGIDERAVHDRAHAALAVLAPREARQLTPSSREQIGDYLLGQRSGIGERLRTRNMLDANAAGRAWATELAAALEPIAASSLPEIPTGSDADASGARERGPERSSSADASGAAAVSRPAGAAGLPGAHASGSLPVSRRGGAIVLAAIAAIVVAVVLLSSGGGSSHGRTSATAGGSRTSSTGTSSTPRATESRRLTLTPPNGEGHALGVAAVLQEGRTYAFYIAAEKLAPSKGFFYAVWLYNSATSYEALSKSPPVTASGRLQGGSLLPSDAAKYNQMILTRETSEHPTSPGPVVLRGAFALH